MDHFTEHLLFSFIVIDGTYQRGIDRHAIKRNIFILDVRYLISDCPQVYDIPQKACSAKDLLVR